ncbi:MAG: DUF488 domain-containing protein [Betaproteobacteria bacterium]|nr:DUF488 domain-containing protein [Betaproteobacteria bacterium]
MWTIGHGNRSIEEFLGLLREAGIERLVDVRAYPASRRHPQFAGEALERSLAEAGIRYLWEGKDLGGRRKLAKNSLHVALKNPGFRAYADHMTTDEFRQGVERLVEIGRSTRVCVMCAERLPWECHRTLISDSLLARGIPVTHVTAPGKAQPHVLSKLARRERGTLIYDAGEQLGLGLEP